MGDLNLVVVIFIEEMNSIFRYLNIICWNKSVSSCCSAYIPPILVAFSQKEHQLALYDINAMATENIQTIEY